MESFEQAMKLDPTWETPRAKQHQLLKYLKDLQDLTNTKGRLKAKKLHQMIQVRSRTQNTLHNVLKIILPLRDWTRNTWAPTKAVFTP